MKPTRRHIDLVLPHETDEMQHVTKTVLMASVRGTSVCLSRLEFEIRGKERVLLKPDIVTCYGMDDQGLNSGSATDISLLYNVHTGGGPHPASYAMGTR
jgi:hypothetical protein